jgi:hypothetical protein
MRNEFFNESTDEIKRVTMVFAEKLKNIKKKSVKSLIVKIMPCFLELFFMARMLFQEAKEIDNFKDWLVHKLLCSQTELDSFKEESESFKEQEKVNKNVKEILMERNKGLELQLHILSDKNLGLNDAIRVSICI